MKPDLLRRLENLVTQSHSRLSRIRRIIVKIERLVIETVLVCMLLLFLIGAIVSGGKIIWYLLINLGK
jgi:cation transport ATPase